MPGRKRGGGRSPGEWRGRGRSSIQAVIRAKLFCTARETPASGAPSSSAGGTSCRKRLGRLGSESPKRVRRKA